MERPSATVFVMPMRNFSYFKKPEPQALMFRWFLRISLASALISIVWFFIPFLRSAESQVKQQQANILEFVAHRNWPRVYLLLAPDYADAWGMKSDEAISAAREALLSFIMVSLDWKVQSVARDGKTVTLSGAIRMSGSGATGSSMIIDHVNRITKPWVCVWRKDGWKPGDWRLVSIANADVTM